MIQIVIARWVVLYYILCMWTVAGDKVQNFSFE